MTTTFKLDEPWPEVIEKLKEANIELTDEDLTYAPGQEQELLERLAAKMHRTPGEIKGWIESVAFTKGKAS
jgi:hypothetical protein